MTNITDISTAPSIRRTIAEVIASPAPIVSVLALERLFIRHTIQPPRSLSHKASILPIHTLDRTGRCIFCQEEPKVFYEASWRLYLKKHDGLPPLTKAEWMFYRTSCTDYEGWTAPHPSRRLELQEYPRTW